MPSCAFVHCKNYTKKKNASIKLSFYTLPKVKTNCCALTNELSVRRLREWLAFIGRKDGPETKKCGYTICSEHFIKGKSADLMKHDDIDWIPSINITPAQSEEQALKLRRSIDRFARRQKKLEQAKKAVDSFLVEPA
ncbi:hypothetical protein B566_EDAN006589 [Ephemera danica]|nr:hypothetical protein B566_EDAN006589 [Ephemera danica]